MNDQPEQREDKPSRRYFLFWRILLCVLSVPLTGWAGMAIFYSNLPGAFLRVSMAATVVLFAVSVFFWSFSLKRAIAFYGIGFAVVLVWWWLIPASNDRQWQTDVAVLSYADISGDTLTIHNIRNYDYTTPKDYTPAYYDKTIDLCKLQTADLFLIYWGSKLIAHTILSFGFEDGSYIAISIETRKEQGEEYSAIKGFFKQFELTYVVADERDVIRLRTNYRKEDVYLYRLRTDPVIMREVFLDYFKQINRLIDQAQWYNALTHNCTTTIRGHAKPYTPKQTFDWRLLANGLIDQMAYERGTISNALPFDELKKRSYINDIAQDLDDALDFSQKIRDQVLPEDRETVQIR